MVICNLSISHGIRSNAAYLTNSKRPIIIAHRGSVGHFPEHCLEGYADAYFSGAEFIELDIQLSADEEIVINYDLSLEHTTNAAEHFAMIKESEKTNDDTSSQYLVHDFTLAEIKELKRK